VYPGGDNGSRLASGALMAGIKNAVVAT